MNADEIRALKPSEGRSNDEDDRERSRATFVVQREIAAHLAELKEQGGLRAVTTDQRIILLTALTALELAIEHGNHIPVLRDSLQGLALPSDEQVQDLRGLLVCLGVPR